MSELVVTGVHKNFGGVPVLCGLDLSVPAGSLAAVLGPSGCGKTTLLRLIAGFEQPDGGSITLGGRLVADSGAALPPEQRRVGIVPQEGALFPHLSVGGNVGFGLPRDRRRAGRIEEVLELVGLGGFKQRRPGELSGGQQQRVALARALAPAPALVLLDEPFSALDSGLRAALRDDVRMALQVSGATALLVTHDQQEALSMADLVAVVRAGRVVQCASPDELYSCPQDLGVATFIGDAVVLPAVLQEGWALTPLGRLPLTGERQPAGAGQVVVRPEQVQLLASGEGVPARVVGTDFYGHDAVVRLVLDDGRHTAVSARCQGRRPALAAVVGVRVAGAVTFFASSGAADR